MEVIGSEGMSASNHEYWLMDACLREDARDEGCLSEYSTQQLSKRIARLGALFCYIFG